MSPLEIIILALAAGLGIAFLIAIGAYLAWDGWRLRRLLESATTATSAAQSQLSLLVGSIRDILDSHHQRMEAVIARINGDKLAAASIEAIQAAKRIEAAAVAIGELCRALLSEEGLLDRGRPPLEPEAYAPPDKSGASYVSLGRTGAGDRADLAGGDDGDEGTPGR